MMIIDHQIKIISCMNVRILFKVVDVISSFEFVYKTFFFVYNKIFSFVINLKVNNLIDKVIRSFFIHICKRRRRLYLI